jgi:hypothetical protein
MFALYFILLAVAIVVFGFLFAISGINWLLYFGKWMSLIGGILSLLAVLLTWRMTHDRFPTFMMTIFVLWGLVTAAWLIFFKGI